MDPCPMISASADLLRDADAAGVVRVISVADVLTRLTPDQLGLYRQESIAASECVISTTTSMDEALEMIRRHGASKPRMSVAGPA